MKFSVGPLVSALGMVVWVGCGDSGGTSNTDSGASTSSATMVSASSSSGTSADPTATPTEDAGSGTMTGDVPTTGTPTTGTPTTGGTDTSATSTTDATTGSSTAGIDTEDSVGSSSSSGGPVADLGDPCGGGVIVPEKGFLWAANSSQGTISKIDTDTVTEVGRYIVRPDSAGSPSRTSVSITGHVAVANRSGGVTKIYSDLDDCEETNGMPGIQTSTNKIGRASCRERV